MCCANVVALSSFRVALQEMPDYRLSLLFRIQALTEMDRCKVTAEEKVVIVSPFLSACLPACLPAYTCLPTPALTVCVSLSVAQSFFRLFLPLSALSTIFVVCALDVLRVF